MFKFISELLLREKVIKENYNFQSIAHWTIERTSMKIRKKAVS